MLFLARRAIENIKRLISANSAPVDLDKRGHLNEKELKQALENRTFFPSYVFDFFDTHTSKENLLENYPKLLSTYFLQEGASSSGFLKNI